jgi:ferredoxin
MPAVVDQAKCEGCEACVPACPVEIITMDNGKAKIGDGCTDCAACESSCPCGAISMK